MDDFETVPRLISLGWPLVSFHRHKHSGRRWPVGIIARYLLPSIKKSNVQSGPEKVCGAFRSTLTMQMVQLPREVNTKDVADATLQVALVVGRENHGLDGRPSSISCARNQGIKLAMVHVPKAFFALS